VSLNGTQLTAFIPQVFGDTSVTIEEYVGTLGPTGMGWVAFHGGNPEIPVWLGAGTATTTTTTTGAGTGTVTDVVWVGPGAPSADDTELWYDTDEAVSAVVDSIEINGAINHDGTTVGFYGAAPVVKPTGVAVSTAAIHAALVSLGLIAP
jgi:hypothetical protein